MPTDKQIEAAHVAANKVANKHTYVSEDSIFSVPTAAEPAQEEQPAAWLYEKDGKIVVNTLNQPWKKTTGWTITPLYTSPTATESWQPIDTAPKDGTRILVWIFEAETTSIVRWVGKTPQYPWASDDGNAWKSSLITHWMPLPAAPKAQALQETRNE